MHNPEEWQRPDEFLPDRFDPDSDLYLTPTGKKRDPMSFIPFNGGKRVCFGKTFAEAANRIVSVMLLDKFDFEFEDESRYSVENGAGEFPLINLSLLLTIPVRYKVKNRKQ